MIKLLLPTLALFLLSCKEPEYYDKRDIPTHVTFVNEIEGDWCLQVSVYFKPTKNLEMTWGKLLTNRVCMGWGGDGSTSEEYFIANKGDSVKVRLKKPVGFSWKGCEEILDTYHAGAIPRQDCVDKNEGADAQYAIVYHNPSETPIGYNEVQCGDTIIIDSLGLYKKNYYPTPDCYGFKTKTTIKTK